MSKKETRKDPPLATPSKVIRDIWNVVSSIPIAGPAMQYAVQIPVVVEKAPDGDQKNKV